MGFGALVSTSNEMTGFSVEIETSDSVLWTFDARPEEQEKEDAELADSDADDGDSNSNNNSSEPALLRWRSSEMPHHRF